MFRENSSVSTDLQGPLLPQKSDLGASGGDLSGVAGMVFSEHRQLRPKEYSDRPNQIQIDKGTFAKLGSDHPLPKEDIKHEFFAQARFLIPSEHFHCEADL